MDVHVRDLRYFLAVADELHFTRAARRLFVSQPALSKQIRGLEQHLRAPLFVRGPGGVALTSAGRALVPHARAVVATWGAGQWPEPDRMSTGMAGREHPSPRRRSVAMATIGLIGSGNIGSTLARLAVDHGHQAVLSNSRGPHTLSALVAELGSSARADTAEGAAAAGDVVVVTIPLRNYRQVPVEPLRGKVVIDTNNYYPQRDGQIPELDDGSTTSSELLQAHLPGSRVVKAFNHILAAHLADLGKPADTPGRRALAVAGDDEEAKATVASLIDEFGFDVVDLGPLAEGWRVQPDTPGYGPEFDAEGLRRAAAEARRSRDTA